MLNLGAKILTAAAAGAFILGTLINPAFAASTIHISASANEVNSSLAQSNSWIFETGAFSEFFSQFFDFSRKLRVKMDGTREVPGPGDPDGAGEAKVKIRLNKSELCVDMEVENIDPATAAHIHHAPLGSAGAVIITLPIPDEEGEADECVSVQNDLLGAIKDNPQDYYINVHNNAYPNGAIRGQLSK